MSRYHYLRYPVVLWASVTHDRLPTFWHCAERENMKQLLMLLAALLAGCASYTPKPLDPAVQGSAFGARSLDAPELRQFVERSYGHELSSWPPKAWDRSMLTLAALHFHPDLDTARARSQLAQAGVVTAGARPNPTLGVSLQHNADASADQSPWTYGLGIDLPIETAGKRTYRSERARHLALAARFRENEALWQVISGVRTSLLVAYPTDVLIRRQHGLQAEITHLLERRFAAGYLSQPELTQARITLNQITLTLAANQKQRAENMARLAAAVGVPVKALETAAISFESFEQVVPVSALPSDAMQREAMRSRPDILASLAEYEASQSALQLEVAKQYPDISIGPGYSWDAGAVKWSLGLSLTLPLLNRNEGPIAEAEAHRKEAASVFLATQAKAIAEVELALAGYGHAVRLFDIADALLRDQNKAERAAAASFKAGESDRLAWLSARYETVTAELARFSALSQVQLTLGQLEDALHRPLGGNVLPAAAEQAVTPKPFYNREQP